MSIGLLLNEDIDEFGCHVIRKARTVFRRASLCDKEDEIYLEDLEGSDISV